MTLNINYIKKLCNVLNINPSDSKINKIMKDLEIMHNSKNGIYDVSKL